MYTEREIIIELPREYKKLQEFLNYQGLQVPLNMEYAYGFYHGSEIIACGALVGDMLQGIAVRPDYHQEGMAAKVVSQLMKKAIELGRENLYIITKPTEICSFISLGFKEVAIAQPFAALLEWGQEKIKDFRDNLKKIAQGKPQEAACIVMNANPFTLGHLHLIEVAAQSSPWLYVLVVEEEKSLFPFKVRLDLIKKGTSGINNLTIVPGGKYVVSSLTFPSYFTREEDLAKAHASLDLEIFIQHIAPSLKIKTRYVGQEPYCPVTSVYNQVMAELLPKNGLIMEEIPRLMVNNKIISASTVRQLIREDKFSELKDFLPESTYQYLMSSAAQSIIKRIKTSEGRH
jgi:[citrate (pro-3S)-lyase] ligase